MNNCRNCKFARWHKSAAKQGVLEPLFISMADEFEAVLKGAL